MRPLIPALLLASTPAFADITPADVINDWREVYAAMGGDFTTDAPEVNGDITRYNDVTATIRVMETETVYHLDWVDMRDNGDGSLSVTLSPEASATVWAAYSASERIEATTSYDFTGATAEISGTPDEMVYSYRAPAISITQTQTHPDGTGDTTIALEGLVGNSTTTRNLAEETVTVTGSASIAAVSVLVNINMPDEAMVELDYHTTEISAPFSYSLSTTPAPVSASFPLPIGMNMTTSLTTGSTTATVKWQARHGSGSADFTQVASSFHFDYTGTSLSYGMQGENATLAVADATPTAPLVTTAFDLASINLTHPLRKSNSVAPFGFAVALTNFTLGDEVWALFDPETTLSRRPASFEMSINGTVQLFTDLYDRSAISALRSAPFELRSLSLASLSLDVEGMGLDGVGNLTFNGARIDPSTGMPEPRGVLDFSITGALGLLDKLGRLGIMDSKVILGAKLSLGMFASPDTGPDSFTSSVEFLDGGKISVNDQPVQ